VVPGYAVFVSRPTGSKIQRADPLTAAIEAGNVFIVKGAWNEAFLDEARTFPAGAHDDQVDALAEGFNWLARRKVQEAAIVAPIQVGGWPDELERRHGPDFLAQLEAEVVRLKERKPS
jgi:hypothetical protein